MVKSGPKVQVRYFEDATSTEAKVCRGLVTSGPDGRGQVVTATYSNPQYK